MRKVDKEDETNQDEHASSDWGDIGSVGHEEFVRNEEAKKAEDKVCEDFRSPPAINVSITPLDE
jgi:hypothetical protein